MAAAEPSDALVRPRVLLLAAGVTVGAQAAGIGFDIGAMASSELFWDRASMWLVTFGLAAALVATVLGTLDRSAVPAGTLARAAVDRRMGLDLSTIALTGSSLVLRRVNVSDGELTPEIAVVASAIGLVTMLASAWTTARLVVGFAAGAAPGGAAGSLLTPVPPAPGRPVHPAVTAARERHRSSAEPSNPGAGPGDGPHGTSASAPTDGPGRSET